MQWLTAACRLCKKEKSVFELRLHAFTAVGSSSDGRSTVWCPDEQVDNERKRSCDLYILG